MRKRCTGAYADYAVPIRYEYIYGARVVLYCTVRVRVQYRYSIHLTLKDDPYSVLCMCVVYEQTL
jgi:hypothetical protein